jgi:hypothetical protein
VEELGGGAIHEVPERTVLARGAVVLHKSIPHVIVGADERHGDAGPVEQHPLDIVTQHVVILLLHLDIFTTRSTEANELAHVATMKPTRLDECIVSILGGQYVLPAIRIDEYV